MKYFLILLLIITGSICQAQDFYRAAGIRGGTTGGFTYRQFLEPDLAYEAIVSFRTEGIQFTILRQHFEPAFWKISNEFFFTHGYGGHVGFSYTNKYRFLYKDIYYSKEKFSPEIGIDGYVGLEYHFPGMPVQVGLDYKPFFSFSLYQFFHLGLNDLAFTVKYTFN